MTTKILGDQITSYTINTEQLSNTATAAFAKTLAPKILYANVASNTYTILDDTAVNVGGGYIVVTGAEFQSGATVLVDTTQASAVTYVNSTTLRAQVPAKSAASYNLYVVNPDGGTGLKVAGITYSGFPTWVTTSPLANVTTNTIFSGTFSATGATTYANTTILPTGFNLLSNGYYYGNISIGADTTYSFDIKATDDELQDSTKTFSLTATTSRPYTITYLAIAGGGGGGHAESNSNGDGGGGGGAGGYIESANIFTGGITYTITVGSGGAGATTTPAERGISGSNTSISSPLGVVVTAVGGGGGGGGDETLTPGGPGGSGGGSGGGYQTPGTGGSGFNFPGALQQGYPGGSSTYVNPARVGAGGGGSGSAGGSVSGSPTGGFGGGGTSSSITGSAIIRAGGGAGGGSGSYPRGAGNSGGGNGGDTNNNAQNGTANYGGGGGGGGSSISSGSFPVNNGGSGGSGVVILSMATANYPGSAPGATVTTNGANTVLTFNSSGTFTA